MPDLAFKPSSYEDIINLPENLVGEIINGQLETHPRPAPKHALAAGSMGAELITAFQKRSDDSGGWWILPEPECHLGNHVLGDCPRIENLLRKSPFGHFFRSFSLNSATIRLK